MSKDSKNIGEIVVYIEDQIARHKVLFDRHLEAVLAEEDLAPRRLREAMGYSLMAGGKRLRPTLCMTAAEVFGASAETVLPMAVSFEMIHTASLIHDDLPCMDNDAMRRGQPTNHVVFGEAMALLAGDALLAWAFSRSLKELSALGHPADVVLKALKEFAEAVGPSGICGGQVLDMGMEEYANKEELVWKTALMKTATLIRASLTTGGILGGASPEAVQCLYNYGTHLGMAFQITDDILDVTGNLEELGKTPGKDAEQGKVTFVSVYGVDGAARLASEESQKAKEAILPLGERARFLKNLPDYIVRRTR